MSEPQIRVHRQKGIEGIEKAIAIHAVSSFCASHGLSVEKLSQQIYDVYNDVAIFSAPSSAKPDGLRNDIETRPVPVLIVERKKGTIEIHQTEHTAQYLS